MTELTPQHEALYGANLSGLDGETGRTYTLANTTYYSAIEFLKQGASLHEGADFDVNTGVVTFHVVVFDSDLISLRYFTSGAIPIVVYPVYAGYCTSDDVYRTAGLTSSAISTLDVDAQILEAETNICRLTKNIYWKTVIESISISSATINTVTVSGAGWTVNAYAGLYLWVYTGTTKPQLAKIVSNTTDKITLEDDFTSIPNTADLFKIFYVPADFNPHIYETYDGTGSNYMFMPKYPIKSLTYLAIGQTPVSVTPSNVYLYDKTGKLQLKPTAEVAIFSNTYPQEVIAGYWYGVDTLPRDVKRLVELSAAIQILGQQMGGTYDDPSSVGLGDLSVVVGQAYINIRSSLETLKEEYTALLKTTVRIYPVFG